MALGDITIRSQILPDISFNVLSVGAGEEHSAILSFIKPSVSTELGGKSITYEPYGKPIAGTWLILLISILVIVGLFLRK